MRNSKDDNDGAARSLFLAGLMIGSVLVGGLFYDFESEGINLAPIIESDVPDSILIGSVDILYVSVNDEDMSSLEIEATLDGSPLLLAPNNTGIIAVDISEVGVGYHNLKMIITDSLGQESRLSATFTIHYPYEDPTVMIVDNNDFQLPVGDSVTINGTLIHPELGTCDLGWSDGDVNVFSLNLPFTDSGKFTWGPSEIESNMTISILATCGTWEDSFDLEIISINITESVMGCTDSEANNYDNEATEDDGSCDYDEEVVVVSGCTDSEANNYDSAATEDDGSCSYDETTRLKILSLHGGGESASDFESQQGMQDLIEALPEFEFIFAETREEGEVWVRDPPGGKEQGTNDPNWADGSISYLDDFIIENGPFYGLLGFSQGAAMSVIYLAYSDVDFEKVILFNGYLETGHQGLNDTIENESPFNIPALVFEGEDDDWFGYGSSELANVFIDATHLVGDAGHHLPYSSDREFDNVVSFIRDTVEYGCTDSGASNFDVDANRDDGSCNYDVQVETGSIEWWNKTLICDDEPPVVDDYSTDSQDNHVCDISFIIEDGNITISTNGLPNHDFESTIGCCASAQSNSYTLPVTPMDDPDCNPTVGSEGCVMAPELGTIAIAVNGVAIFGPEDGPGGDAVALEEGAYEQEEGEQEVDLGVCHGHSGPGGVYHYHADANCIHWHAQEGENMYDYHLDSQRSLSAHSKIVGFALDGYSIYGYTGWDEDGEVVEMTSSYRLKDGQDGSGGIDDYEYIQGLGSLDACNGIFSATPDWPEGIYHYHTTMFNGEGGIGFPYFINCYAGEIPTSEEGEGDDDPCAGHGETWGPGIGPPPDGCGGGPGGQSSEEGLIAIPWLTNPPNNGLIMVSLLMLVTVTRYSLRGLASGSIVPNQAGKVREYHLIPRLT